MRRALLKDLVDLQNQIILTGENGTGREEYQKLLQSFTQRKNDLLKTELSIFDDYLSENEFKKPLKSCWF